MVDKSWGTPNPSGLRVRTNDSPSDRAAKRAEARAARDAERATFAVQRTEARGVAREAEAAAREQAREQRRIEEQRAASGDPHAAAAARRRGSGRKDVHREQRDTRSYATTLDVGRMRELAKRGASLAGLAGAFGITVAEVEAALADD